MLDDTQNVHDVAALLKEFFRDMKDSLLPDDLYMSFLLTASESSDVPSPRQGKELVRGCGGLETELRLQDSKELRQNAYLKMKTPLQTTFLVFHNIQVCLEISPEILENVCVLRAKKNLLSVEGVQF